MSQKNLFTKSALAAAVAIISSNVYAAGFQLNEFSAVGLGRAYSGEGAVADTAASASRNPATMMMFDRPSSPLEWCLSILMWISQVPHLQARAWTRRISRQPLGCLTCTISSR